MHQRENINVREIEIRDISLITDYWLRSDPDFLIGMGVDLKKLPSKKGFEEMLSKQISLPLNRKESYAVIWEYNEEPIGHSNLNEIVFGKQAKMHLHIWKTSYRQKGIGTKLLQKSLLQYFEKLQLEKLICEPYSFNTAPNKALQRIGFEFIKQYKTIPGALNFEQLVNRWELTKDNLKI